MTYLITFFCYGAHLHGDERGTVDRHHNWKATPETNSLTAWLGYTPCCSMCYVRFRAATVRESAPGATAGDLASKWLFVHTGKKSWFSCAPNVDRQRNG
jgi:hypothetical protein